MALARIWPYAIVGIVSGTALYHYTEEGSWWRYAAFAVTVLLIGRGLYVR